MFQGGAGFVGFILWMFPGNYPGNYPNIYPSTSPSTYPRTYPVIYRVICPVIDPSTTTITRFGARVPQSIYIPSFSRNIRAVCIKCQYANGSYIYGQIKVCSTEYRTPLESVEGKKKSRTEVCTYIAGFCVHAPCAPGGVYEPFGGAG